jgi:hypothetical protein
MSVSRDGDRGVRNGLDDTAGREVTGGACALRFLVTRERAVAGVVEFVFV